jgi:hypothetical protein
MSEERDKDLTIAMGETWNVWDSFESECKPYSANNFSTPDGFFKLWNWAKEQEWFWEGVFHRLDYQVPELFINPDRFADAVYAYLKERDK